MNATLLWNNTNPRLNFSKQTISLDLTKYTHVVIEYALSNSEHANEFVSCIVEKNGMQTCNSGCTTKREHIYLRYATCTDGSVAFSDGYLGYGNIASVNNACFIPLRVYGLNINDLSLVQNV